MGGRSAPHRSGEVASHAIAVMTPIHARQRCVVFCRPRQQCGDRIANAGSRSTSPRKRPNEQSCGRRQPRAALAQLQAKS
jgi:hypothetical protein